MKVVCDDKIPYLKGVLEPYVEQVVYLPGAKISNSDLIDAEALIVRTRTICNENLLKGTKVKFIATATIGFDHIDVDYCKSSGIYWTNAPGCNSGSVKQYIGSVLSFLIRKYSIEPENTTIGIVGVGNVGSKVESLAKALGFRVLLNDPPRQRAEGDEGFVSFEEIKAKADIITFHVPLNKTGIDKTFHLADDVFFDNLGKERIIINSSRGEVVDNKALKAALKGKKLKAAVLDVWENEPEIDLDLLKAVSIATPHIAGYSKDGKANGTAMSVMALVEFFGLAISDWFPNNVEMPGSNEIVVPDDLLGIEAQIYAIEKTYKVEEDSKRLKKSPFDFEKLRGDYPVRREFQNYTIRNSENILFTGLGFK